MLNNPGRDWGAIPCVPIAFRARCPQATDCAFGRATEIATAAGQPYYPYLLPKLDHAPLLGEAQSRTAISIQATF